MHHRTYEFLANEHIDTLRQEAEGRHLAAAVEARNEGPIAKLLAGWSLVRRAATRMASVGHRAPVQVARPRRDLGAS